MPSRNAENDTPQRTPRRSPATVTARRKKAGVAATPAPQQPFSWRLPKAKQCLEGVLYELREDTDEYEFFYSHVADALKSILEGGVDLHEGDNVLPALDDIIKEELPDALRLRSIEVPMLAKTDKPYVDNPHPDEFYTTDDEFVLLPSTDEFADNTTVYKLHKSLQSYKFDIKIHFQLCQYDAQLRIAMRTVGSRNEGVQLTLQESGAPVCVTTCGDEALILKTDTAFLKPDFWPNPRRTRTGPSPRTEPRAEESRLDKEFCEDDDGTHLVKKRGDEDVSVKILNATLHDLRSIIRIPTPNGEVTTLHRLVLKTKRTPTTAHLPEYIATGDLQQPEPGDYNSEFIYVEILLDIGKCKSNSSIMKHFTEQFAFFSVNMKPEIFTTVMQYWFDKSSPEVQEAVIKFGLQDNDKTFIFGNLTFDIGSDPVPINLNKHFVHKKCFSNIKPSQFPMVTVCPFRAPRFAAARWVFKEGLDYKCGKNADVARFAFSVSSMAVRARQFWSGAANEVAGMPLVWIVAAQANSGKTTVLHALSAVFGKRCPLLSATTTRVALMEHGQRDSHLAILVDDLTKSEQIEKIWEQHTRMNFDGTAYECYKNQRALNCMSIVTSNAEFNKKSAPDQQRKIVVHMPNVVTSKRNKKAAELWRQLVTDKRLSSILPDICTLGGEQLSTEAMQDFSHFLCELLPQTKGTKNRVAMLWGTALFCNIMWLVALNLQELIAPAFETVVGMYKQHQIQRCIEPGEKGRFIMAFIQALRKNPDVTNRYVKKTGCLHVHNYHCNGHYANLSFPQINTTLKEMTGEEFDPLLLRRYFEFRDKVLFYDAETSSWPPVCKRVPHEGQAAFGEMITVPATMEDLADCDCHFTEAIVVDLTEVQEYEARMNGESIDALDYKTLMIESAFGDEINLFEQCEAGTYPGFGALYDHPWAEMSGLKNSKLDCDAYMRALGTFEHFDYTFKDEYNVPDEKNYLIYEDLAEDTMRAPDPLTADDMLQMLTTDNSAVGSVVRGLTQNLDNSMADSVVDELAQEAELDSLLKHIDSPPSWSKNNARAVRHDSPVRSRSRSRSPVRSRSQSPVRWGKCSNVVDWDSDGQDVLCGEDCSPNEQICHRCRRGLY